MLFRSLEDTGFGQTFLEALHEDVKWTVMGTSPFSGTYTGKAQYVEGALGKVHKRLGITTVPIVQRILADKEWCVIQFLVDMSAEKSETGFSMDYCWVMRRLEDKIVEVYAYPDQKKLSDMFA